jgi:predicted MFS family arabinose efflux permease
LLLLGATSSAIQVLVPIAASMVPPERRGQMIGDVMSGLMVGILLSRPLASFIADKWSWRGFYAVSAAALILVTIFLVIKLPRRYPERGPRYPALIASLGRLLRTERTLRRRSLTAALTMGSFSIFWTSIGPRLTEPPFFLDQQGIAIFAIAGAGGAVATPIFGRLGDRGLTRPALLAADLILLLSVCVAAWAAMAAFAVDFGVVGDQTLGRRAINLLAPEARGRTNAIFVGVFFVGGAVGSALAGPVQALGGWPATCALTATFGVAALLVNAMDRSSQAVGSVAGAGQSP